MSDSQTPPRRYETTIGNYTEDAGVFYSDTVRRADFTVPAAVSKNGAPMAILPNAGTVIFTESETALGADIFVHHDLPDNIGAMHLNNVALIAALGQLRTLEGYDPVRLSKDAMTETEIGPFALRNLTGGGLLASTGQSPDDWLEAFTGVEIENLNITPAQREGLVPFINAHEVTHLKDSQFFDRNRFASETYADMTALDTYFNADFKSFVMDIRALDALNDCAPDEDHPVHLWSEEWPTGALPTEADATAASGVPILIDQTVKSAVQLSEPELSQSDITTRMSDPAQRYGAIKALRELGTFDEEPLANEYIDKYLAAAERLYKPEYLAQSGLEEYRENFTALAERLLQEELENPQIDEASPSAATPMPATSMPVTSMPVAPTAPASGPSAPMPNLG